MISATSYKKGFEQMGLLEAMLTSYGVAGLYKTEAVPIFLQTSG